MDAFKKNRFKIVLIIIFLVIIFFIGKYFYSSQRIFAPTTNYLKTVILSDNGSLFFTTTNTQTVSDFLIENEITLAEFDQVIPEKNSTLVSGAHIFIRRAAKIKIEVDGKTIENYTLAPTVRTAILENNITLGRLDKADPDFNFLPTNNSIVIVTRINVEEKIIPEEINFKTTTKNDSKLGWQEKKIEQKGEKGTVEVKYKITYKNGKEISRVVLEKNTLKEPLTEIVVQGTYMKLGKATRGQASHYAKSWGNLNASRDIPRGGYAKVTNMANGKSTVVKINDYGPQSPSRVIDLSYAAFVNIATAGQGIIPSVKVEQILN